MWACPRIDHMVLSLLSEHVALLCQDFKGLLIIFCAEQAAAAGLLEPIQHRETGECGIKERRIVALPLVSRVPSAKV